MCVCVMSKLNVRTMCGVCAAAFVALLGGTSASSHPHVFVKVKTQLIAKDGALVGLRHTWMFDETWLENQLLEHDKDNDGKLSRDELKPLEDESRQTLEMFKSFTVVRSGGALVRVANPRDVVVDYAGSLLGLSFTVSLLKPLPLTGSELLLEAYDATFFSSFTFDGADAVAFADGAPAGCTIKIDVPASPQQMSAYRMVKKQMGPEWVDKAGVPRSVAISCTKGGAIGASDAVGLHMPVSTR